ncbi:DUF397 domain-containing protein [Streptomyces populi]|uniref:DUF397 domain-containing protein n=2 Tax=Streptomyces populi TaxID=2058924 RepID=A0A2I0SHZ2_9ACTN|nr:DUF397 domain-containing protein [Streptomyces populi]PKT69555.1 DUF397 domain-containing protein [Streptomyces populi]
MPGADASLCWLKSSYSSEEGGECVEVAFDAVAVHVRDSKQALERGPVLRVGPAAWSALLEAM